MSSSNVSEMRLEMISECWHTWTISHLMQSKFCISIMTRLDKGLLHHVWPFKSQGPWQITMHTIMHILSAKHSCCHIRCCNTILFNTIVQTTWHVTLQWRHNEGDGVSNHRRLDCLLNRLIRHRSKKTSKIHVTGFCEGNSRVTGEFPA